MSLNALCEVLGFCIPVPLASVSSVVGRGWNSHTQRWNVATVYGSDFSLILYTKLRTEQRHLSKNVTMEDA